MRGEEVQTLGAITTKSIRLHYTLRHPFKHVLVSNEKLTHFDTFLTGELINLTAAFYLSRHRVNKPIFSWVLQIALPLRISCICSRFVPTL